MRACECGLLRLVAQDRPGDAARNLDRAGRRRVHLIIVIAVAVFRSKEIAHGDEQDIIIAIRHARKPRIQILKLIIAFVERPTQAAWTIISDPDDAMPARRKIRNECRDFA